MRLGTLHFGLAFRPPRPLLLRAGSLQRRRSRLSTRVARGGPECDLLAPRRPHRKAAVTRDQHGLPRAKSDLGAGGADDQPAQQALSEGLVIRNGRPTVERCVRRTWLGSKRDLPASAATLCLHADPLLGRTKRHVCSPVSGLRHDKAMLLLLGAIANHWHCGSLLATWCLASAQRERLSGRRGLRGVVLALSLRLSCAWCPVWSLVAQSLSNGPHVAHTVQSSTVRVL
mmetsp:Transcript_41959/g.94799  ORF Transcript_41959/g.94799 Transcript_41959/m.94799 type:complete len:229 (+) Transcript_41959:43-729(+)